MVEVVTESLKTNAYTKHSSNKLLCIQCILQSVSKASSTLQLEGIYNGLRLSMTTYCHWHSLVIQHYLSYFLERSNYFHQKTHHDSRYSPV